MFFHYFLLICICSELWLLLLPLSLMKENIRRMGCFYTKCISTRWVSGRSFPTQKWRFCFFYFHRSFVQFSSFFKIPFFIALRENKNLLKSEYNLLTILNDLIGYPPPKKPTKKVNNHSFPLQCVYLLKQTRKSRTPKLFSFLFVLLRDISVPHGHH